MPTRSQRHVREIRGVDSSGGPTPPITGIAPDTATLTAAGAVGRTICTAVPSGGTAPFTYSVAVAAGLACAFTGANLLTTVNPAGTVGAKATQVTVTDARGQTKTEVITVTLT